MLNKLFVQFVGSSFGLFLRDFDSGISGESSFQRSERFVDTISEKLDRRWNVVSDLSLAVVYSLQCNGFVLLFESVAFKCKQPVRHLGSLAIKSDK